MTDFIRQCWTGLRALLVLTALLGIAYPVVVWGIGRTAFPDQADGSLIVRGDQVVGSRLLGQDFTGDRWFLSRPSANNDNGLASGGSNLGGSNPALISEIAHRRADVAARERVAPSTVPADAVTASASGLDPYISPAYARLQIARVARTRGLPPEQVSRLVSEHVQPRMLGFLGEPRVNVLQLDLALARA